MNKYERNQLAIQLAQSQVTTKATYLESRARSLAEDLIKLADKLKDNQEEATVNSLGEVQGRGAAVDILCAEFTMAQENLKLLQQLLKEED